MLLVSNWKAYVEKKETAEALFQAAKKLSARHELVLAVPAPFIGLLAASRANVALAAQDVSVTLGGATTGEVTAGAVKAAGASYVIVGHSERRAMGESDEVVLEKVRHILAQGLTPILCIGEQERDVDAQYLKVVRQELASVFGVLSPKECKQMIVAYEPIWAIGKSAAEAITNEDLREMIFYIRKVISDYLPGKGAEDVRILYGGSIEAANISALSKDTAIDGFLIGHASADVESYTALVKALD